jgi:hypothetical protein
MDTSTQRVQHHFKDPGAFVKWMDRHQKYVGEVSVFSFLIAAEQSRVLIVSTDKNLKE